MADAPDNATYLIIDADAALPESRLLTADAALSNLQFIDSGPGGTYELFPTLNLLAVANLSTPGMLAFSAGSGIINRTLSSDGSITITNPAGDAGAPFFAVVDNTSIQWIQVQGGGTPTANPRSILNFINGTNVTISTVDNSGSSRTDVTISAATGAPTDGSFILASAATGNSFDLGTLTSGLLKIGVSGSVATPARAIPSTDYMAPTASLIDLAALTATTGSLIAAVAGHWQEVPPGDSGQVLTMLSATSVGWDDSPAGDNATFLCQTSSNLPTFGIDLSNSDFGLAIGKTTPGYSLDIVNAQERAADDFACILLSSQASGGARDFGGLVSRTYTGFSAINLFRGQGTIATPTTIAGAVPLGAINFGGYDGTEFRTTAYIESQSTQAFTGSAQGTSLKFFNVANDTAYDDIEERMIIDQTGFVGINTAATTYAQTPAYQLEVYSNDATPVVGAVAEFVADSTSPSYKGILVDAYTRLGQARGGAEVYLRTALGNANDAGPISSGFDYGTISASGGYQAGSNPDNIFLARSGQISFTATQTFTGTALGTAINFRTTPNDTPTAATVMTIDQSGYVGIGKEVPDYPLDVSSTATSGTLGSLALNGTTQSTGGKIGGIFLTNSYGAEAAAGAAVVLRSSRGTIAAPTATISGDLIGRLLARGRGATGYLSNSTGALEFYAAETFTDAIAGTNFRIRTTPTGSNDIATSVIVTGGSNPLVGIGVTPAYPLDVYSTLVSGTGAGMQVVVDTGTNTTGTSYFTNYGGTSPSSLISLKSARGTLAAPRRVQSSDFFGSFGSIPYYAVDDSSTGAFATGATAYMAFAALEAQTSTAQGNRIDFYTTPITTNAPTPTMSIKGGSTVPAVGIGTTTPVVPLDVYSTTSIASPFTAAVGLQVVTNPGNNNQGHALFIAYGGAGGNSNIGLSAARGTLAAPTRIQSGDTIGGIRVRPYASDSASAGTGDFTNAAAAQIIFSAAETQTLSAQGTRINISTTPIGSTTVATSVTIQGGGTTNAKVGIGMTPTTMLELVSDSAQKPSTNLWTITSDARIKTDIVDVEDALPIINKVLPRKYKYTQEHIQYLKDQAKSYDEDTGECTDEGTCSLCPVTEYYGFVADELETVLPSCVKTTESSSGEHKNLKTVNPHDLYILMVKAIQELSAKVAALEAQLAA